ncbi:MAG: UUP1 family membrane protein [Gammaproteobacteria bacterium]
MNKRHLYVLSAALTLIALMVFFFKVFVLHFPLLPDTTSDSWEIEVRAAFRAYNAPVKLSMYVPRSTSQYALIDENFISKGYGFSAKNVNGSRKVIWSTRRASGNQVLYYRAIVRRVADAYPVVKAEAEPVTPVGYEGAHRAAADTLIADIRAHSADIDSFVTELLKRLNSPEKDENVSLLLGRKPDNERRIAVAIDVLAEAGIPARVVHGVRLQELQRDVVPVAWLEVAEKGVWRPYDAAKGTGKLPDDYLTWWRGSEPLVTLKGARDLKTRLAIRLIKESALSGAAMRGRFMTPGLIDFSLLSLPIETQAVYQVLLLVPLGAFLLVVLRNIVGVKTFGTFMPVLIALSFRETQLLWGIILFALVVGLGLTVRFYLDQLKLLLVPRLASVLIVVVLLMAVISVFSFKLGIERGLSVALFPMIIMTMTIERMSIVWEERGAAEAIEQGIGSLAVAAAAYLVMSIDFLRHLVFVFPELLLILLASTLLLGRYSGYRLTELVRFRAMTRE